MTSDPQTLQTKTAEMDSDQRSASSMLRTMILFAWILAGVVVVSGAVGYGTQVSFYIAIGWFLLLGIVLAGWKLFGIRTQRILAILILGLIMVRWTMAWLVSQPADAMIGILIGLIYTPVLITITALMFARQARWIGLIVGAFMGAIAIAGSFRPELSPMHLDDWRIGPLVLSVYMLFAWFLGMWVQDRRHLERAEGNVRDLTVAALTDSLTGLANRRAAELALEAAGRGGRRFAVLLLDIDHFKRVNDTFGHDAGDTVLQRLAGILQRSLRLQDTAARWGGEEFIIIVESLEPDNALSVARMLRSRIETQTAEDPIPVTVSIGVAHASGEQSIEALLMQADQALYAAKHSGRNRVAKSW